MANTLRFKRGLVSGIPTAALGEPLFTTDTFDLYIGNGTGNTRFQKYIASGATTQILRGDGSLYTFPLAISSPSNGQVLKYNGTSWVNDSDAGITGSGSAGQVAYFTGATTQAGSNNLFWDATNFRLGIGTNAPSRQLHLYRSGAATEAYIQSDAAQQAALYFKTLGTAIYVPTSSSTELRFYVNSADRVIIDSSGNVGIGVAPNSWTTWKPLQLTGGGALASYANNTIVSNNYFFDGADKYIATANATIYKQTLGQHIWYTAPSGTGGTTATFTQAMTLFATGNFGINTSATDSGQRLQVIGTGYFSDSVGIGTSTLTGYSLHIAKTIGGGVGAFGYAGIWQDGVVQSTVTQNVFGIINSTRTQAGTYTIPNYYHFFADQYALGAGSTITNQYGYWADSTLTSATNNFGFYGNIASGTGRWNLYMNGTANNYMAGRLAIGTTLNIANNSFQVARTMTGTVTNNGISSYGQIQSDVTTSARYFVSESSTQATTFTLNALIHYAAFQGTFGAGSTVSFQNGFYVDSTMIGATNNYGFRGVIPSGTNRWNIYMDGTALNYLNGSLLIGSTTDSGEKLQVTGTMKVTGASSFGGNLTVGNSLAVLYNVANSEAALFQRSGSYGAVIRLGRVGVTNSTTIDYPADGSFAVSTAGSERMRLDASGNLGLGITPAAWSLASLSAMQIQNGGFYGYSVNEVGVTSNSYYNAGWKYINSSFATQYSTFNGAHRWYNAPSGTAGNAITFTQAMTLDASGRLGVGTGANSLDAQIVTDGTTSSRINMRGGGTRWGTLYADAGLFAVASTSSIPLVLGTNDTEKMRITTNGNLHIGTYTSDSGEKLQVTGTAKFTSDISLISSANAVLTIDALSTNTAAFIFKRSGTEAGRIAFSNSANMIFHTGSAATQRMVIDGSTGAVSVVNNFAVDTNTLFVDATNNRVGILTTTPSYSLDVQGTGYFNDNVRFPNNKGVIFVQTGGSLLGSISMDITNRVTIANNGFSGVSVATDHTFLGGNFSVGHSGAVFGGGTRAMSMLNGTAPSSSFADAFLMYSNDVTAGNAAPHIRTENGAVIKLYQETTSVGNSIISLGGGNAVLDDTTFDGYTLRQIVKALRNQGILA